MTVQSGSLEELGAALLALSPEDLAAVCAGSTPEEMEAIEAALALPELELALGRNPELGWRNNPATMAHHLTRGRVRLWRYAALLGEKFRNAVTGESPRQLWNLPRRYGKSWWASQWGPAWALDRDASLKLILVSYGDKLAVTNAVAIRDILREYNKVLRTELRPDRQEQRQFVTTEGGGVLAAGIMSGLTGFGAHGVIFDDPFKDWQEAHSEARRDLVDNQFRAVVASGLETEDAFIICAHTRWHEDDTTGRLLKRMEDATGEAWELVRIPEVAEAVDPTSSDRFRRMPDLLGRQEGEVIEPERFSPAAVASRQLSLGSYLTASMSQQRPAPEEGGEIKRAWWRLEDAPPPAFDDALTSFDMKLKDKESGDFVVGQAWGRTGKDCWLLGQVRGQWNQATTENAICLLALRHPECKRHIIENTGNGPEVMAALRAPHEGYEVSEDIAGQLGMTEAEREAVGAMRRRGISGLIPNNPKGSKTVRMRAVSGYIEAGDVHLLRNWAGLGPFLDEMSAFNNGSFDDQVDAASQALSKLLRGSSSVSAATGDLPRAPISTRGQSGMLPAPPARNRRNVARTIIPRGPFPSR